MHSRDQDAFTLSFAFTNERVGRAFHKNERDWQKMTPISFYINFLVYQAEGGEFFVCQNLCLFFP
jgi:hypothetical protein